MKLCYLGLYDPEFGRNKVYIAGLKQNGVEIVECRDASGGLVKFWRLWKEHRRIVRAAGSRDLAYDALVVGYPGHIIVPFAKLLAGRKKVVFDALCTLYEGEVMSRGRYRFNIFMKGWIMLVDLMAAKSADLILVETEAQKDFFVKRFSLHPDKVVRIFTGCDEDIYHPEKDVAKRERFTAVFRGKFLPEAGAAYIVQAAKALEDAGADILIIGNGHSEEEVWSAVRSLKPRNLHWIRERLPDDLLRNKMLECHAALGQFADHERLERTIPHKAFEALAMGLPYITGRSGGVSELLTDGKDCLMTSLADPEDIAAKILLLKDQPERAREIGESGRRLFEERLTSVRLGKEIISAILQIA